MHTPHVTPRFRNRREAGRALASKLSKYSGRRGLIVLALPRGGVPVAYEVARALEAPLDVFLVRKLGIPGHEELAMGAIATGGVRVLNRELVQSLGIPESLVESITAKERSALDRAERLYRNHRTPADLAGKTVILVDDGLATGATVVAAIKALRNASTARILVAVPVAARETCEQLKSVADGVVCAETPEPFRAVGLWYEDFSPTSDDEVRELLEAAANQPASGT